MNTEKIEMDSKSFKKHLVAIARAEGTLTKHMEAIIAFFKDASIAELQAFKPVLAGEIKRHKSVSSFVKIQTILNKLLKGDKLPDDTSKGIDTLKKEMSVATPSLSKELPIEAVDASKLDTLFADIGALKALTKVALEEKMLQLSNIQITTLKIALEVLLSK